jgi:hypothetical protein
MFIFGHLGIGRRLASPWRARLPALPLMLGMLLPDLIDKPLYYARISPFISSTRTLGHTFLFLILLCGYAVARRSSTAAALAVGVVTHLLLDGFLETFDSRGLASSWHALAWPFMSPHFATLYIPTMSRHLRSLWAWPVAIGELVGMGLIGWEVWQGRRSKGSTTRIVGHRPLPASGEHDAGGTAAPTGGR